MFTVSVEISDFNASTPRGYKLWEKNSEKKKKTNRINNKIKILK
jgi:hypothetical protein